MLIILQLHIGQKICGNDPGQHFLYLFKITPGGQLHLDDKPVFLGNQLYGKAFFPSERRQLTLQHPDCKR